MLTGLGLLAAALALGACSLMAQRQDGRWSEAQIRYTTASWPRPLTGQLYQPAGTGPFPAVLLVHGGGWDSRDRSDMESLARRLAAEGYVALNIDYRLAPEFRYPAQIEDVQQALRWIAGNAARLHVDAERIGAWGYSAGAHLVALAATRQGPGEPRLAAVVAGGLPSDLPRYPLSPIISKFIGGSYADRPAAWEEASPLRNVSSGTSPMFLYHGTWDRLVYFDDSAAMKRALDEAGVPARLHPVRGLGHVATFVLGFGARAQALSFLDEYLKR